MYEKIAWNHFVNTGDINSFLEYRKITNIKNEMKMLENINEGEIIDEFTEGKGDSYKRDTI